MRTSATSGRYTPASAAFCLAAMITCVFPATGRGAEPLADQAGCILCHEKETPEVVAAWKASPHNPDVSCSACHGGNAAEPDKVKAHAGIRRLGALQRVTTCGQCHKEQLVSYITSAHEGKLSEAVRRSPGAYSNGVVLDAIATGAQPLAGPECTTCHGVHAILSTSNKEAPTYLQQRSELCGLVCHRPIYEQFTESDHYTMLRSERRAPTCSTCHSGHADQIVPIDRLAKTCAECHVPGGPAGVEAVDRMRDVLSLAAVSQNMYSSLGARVTPLRMEGWDTAAAEGLLGEAESKLQAISRHWHSFDQGVLLADLEWIIGKLREAEGALRQLKMVLWVAIAMAVVWAFVALLAWIAYVRSRRPNILFAACGFTFLFLSMLFTGALARNLLQVAGAVMIAGSVVFPEIVLFFRLGGKPKKDTGDAEQP